MKKITLTNLLNSSRENANENFSLLIAEIAFIRSADNYVEIIYKEGVTYKRT